MLSDEHIKEFNNKLESLLADSVNYELKKYKEKIKISSFIDSLKGNQNSINFMTNSRLKF